MPSTYQSVKTFKSYPLWSWYNIKLVSRDCNSSKSVLHLLSSKTKCSLTIKFVNYIGKMFAVFDLNYLQLIIDFYHHRKCKTVENLFLKICNCLSHILLSKQKMQAQAKTSNSCLIFQQNEIKKLKVLKLLFVRLFSMAWFNRRKGKRTSLITWQGMEHSTGAAVAGMWRRRGRKTAAAVFTGLTVEWGGTKIRLGQICDRKHCGGHRFEVQNGRIEASLIHFDEAAEKPLYYCRMERRSAVKLSQWSQGRRSNGVAHEQVHYIVIEQKKNCQTTTLWRGSSQRLGHD